MADKHLEGPDEEKSKLMLENQELQKALRVTERSKEAAEQRAEEAEQRVEVAEQRVEVAEQRVEVAEQKAQDAERENSTLKEQMSLANDHLATETRQKEQLQQQLTDSLQVEERRRIADEKVHSLNQNLDVLVASVESKSSFIAELEHNVSGLERELRDTQEQLKNANQDKRTLASRVEQLKLTCDGFFRQVTGLILQEQESEDEITFLFQVISQLREEIDVLRVAGGNTPSALH